MAAADVGAESAADTDAETEAPARGKMSDWWKAMISCCFVCLDSAQNLLFLIFYLIFRFKNNYHLALILFFKVLFLILFKPKKMDGKYLPLLKVFLWERHTGFTKGQQVQSGIP